MKRIILALIVAAALGLGNASAYAETQYKDSEYLALVQKALAGQEPVDYKEIRALYSQTSFYDPYGGAQAVWYNLQRAGQQIIYDPSPESTQEYDTLLAQHFAHFRSHMQAIEMIDKKHLPEEQRGVHQKALSGIVSSILATGDGKKPETAFHVIDPAEEGLVLKTYFHYQLKSQEFRQQAGHFWDVLNYTDPAKGEDGTLYFNVDRILATPRKN